MTRKRTHTMKKSTMRYTQEATSSAHAAAAHHGDRSGGAAV
jgi:hypothetical protein